MSAAESERFVYAGFWVRVGAMLIDLAVVGWLLSRGFGRVWALALPNPQLVGGIRLSSVLVAVLFWSYLVLSTAWFGRTLGKHLLGLRVVSTEHGRPDLQTVLFREVVGRVISGAIFLVGYLAVGSDPRKQGWHDRVADTYVLRRFTLLDVPDPWIDEARARPG